MSFRVALTTLGCKVNQADSDALADAFAAAGCRIVEPEAAADAYVVNTCTVTLVADRKARKLVRQVARRNPAAVVAVTGCYVEGLGRAVFEALPEVDVLRGTSDRATLPAAVLLELRRRRALGLLPPDGAAAAPAVRPRAMLKVQDGCRHVCRYCIVPAVRGEMVSRRPGEVLDEARRRLDEGTRELVLCGIRLGAYGWDWPDRRGSRFRPLSELVEALAGLDGLLRLRLSSLLPLDVGPDLFALLADLPPVCEHLHLPLQSGDDEILRAMGRGYRAARFLELVDRARTALPDLALATDILVGYPGETEAHFEQTLAVCHAAAFADLHVFPYSPRSGAPAAELPDDVPPAVKQARTHRLIELRDAARTAFRRRHLGRPVEILVEVVGPGWIEGLTRDYIRVRATGDGRAGELAEIELTALAPDTCAGRRVTVRDRQDSVGGGST